MKPISPTIALAFIASAFMAPLAAKAASFDCQKARTAVEKAICANPALGELDVELATAYREFLKSSSTDAARKDMVSVQKAWLSKRNACATDQCLEEIYKGRIHQLCASHPTNRGGLCAEPVSTAASDSTDDDDTTDVSDSEEGADSAVMVASPLNGWRNTTGETARYTQDVHYPAVAVSVPDGQPAGAVIAGRIRAAPKPAAPKPAGEAKKAETENDGSVATLVVNGVSMPQRVEADGQFARPYAFASGSNSVELRTGQGERRRVQFYDNNAGKLRPRLRIVLSWDSDGTDLDLHVIAPDGQHTFYGERVAANGGALDVDVTTGYGPEIYSSAAPPPGQYLVYANYYGGENPAIITVAQITIITDENTAHEKQQMVQVPMREPGELTLVKSFVMQ